MTRNAPRLPGPLEAELRGDAGGFRIEAAFSAPAGETTAVFGPSGSGKTTLLRAVSGLARLGGRVAAGRAVWQDDARGLFLPAHRRRVGFAFQEPALFAHLPVAGNLRYAEDRSGGGAARPEDPGLPGPPFAEVVERLGLGPYLDRAPAGLSGGERQRVSLGRALLSRPSVLLLDEPLSALHESARARLLPWLRSLAPEFGMATLHVSHDLGEVARVADRMVLLDRGRVADAGPVEGVFERLYGRDWGDRGGGAGRFEAGSLLTARVAAHRQASGMTELDLGGQRLLVPGRRGSPAAPGEAVRLRVRARDVALATRRPEAISVRNILEGAVLEVAARPGGAFAEVLVEVAGARLRARLTREAVSDLALAPGVPVFALLRSVAFDEP